jgi:hypothetical protein
MKKQEVIELIRDAWRLAEYEGVVDKSLRDSTPHPEERESRKRFLGLHWSEVPEFVLTDNYPSPYLIGDVAFRYYLPAFMLFAIKENEWSDTLDCLINHEFRVPVKDQPRKSFQNRFDQLTYIQKKAVAEFMRYAAETIYSSIEEGNYNSRVRSRIRKSLD